MTAQDQIWDQRLRIQTAGRDDTNADQYRHPYEPTPYCVLQRLADSGFFREGDTVLDYGCGKGRVGFFLSHRTGARVIGIEYDEHIFRQAQENLKSACPGAKAAFLHLQAEAYALSPQINRCYFFNPFSVHILQKVMARIMDSYYRAPRQILFFFYYPAEEYIAYLMTVDELEFYDDIPCQDLFAGSDSRERILIFRLPGYDT